MREREPPRPDEGEKKAARNRLSVTRHTTLERLAHYAIIGSLLVLMGTGFNLYFGLPYLDYRDAFGLHVISAAVFLAINWIVVPYSAISNGRVIEYWFWPSDARRLWQAIANFFTGSEYPRYTVYDERRRKFRNRMHPAGKLILYSHYLGLLLATLTGVVLFSPTLDAFGIGVSGIIVILLDFASPYFGLSGLGFARVIHLAAAYWFVIEIVLHMGLVIDPKKFSHIKSIFLTGKEDLMKDPTAEIVNTTDDQ